MKFSRTLAEIGQLPSHSLAGALPRPNTFAGANDAQRDIYESLRSMLLDGSYSSGDHLPASILADSLRSSITPVREALIRLSAECLVENIQGRGFFVRGIGPQELIQQCVFVSALLMFAVTHQSPQHRTRYIPPSEKLKRSPKATDAISAETAESRAVFLEQEYADLSMLSGNGFIIDTVRQFNARTHTLRRSHLNDEPLFERSIEALSKISICLTGNLTAIDPNSTEIEFAIESSIKLPLPIGDLH